MKKIFILLLLGNILIGCSENGGGVTSDPPVVVIPGPTPAPTPVIPAGPSVFNLLLSELKITNTSGAIVTEGQVSQSLKLVLVAKDQYGAAMTGLSLKMGIQYSTDAIDLIPTQSTPGTYVIDFTIPYQASDVTGYFKISDIEQNKYTAVNISYCNGPSSPGASPFHTQATIASKNFYIICTPAQLAQAGSSAAYAAYNFSIGKNIDLTSFYVDANSDGIPENQFKIGTSLNPYTGHFLGSGFNINKFTYKSTGDDSGLFGVVGAGATINLLSLTNADVSGANNVGILAGRTQSSSGVTTVSSIVVSSSALKGSGDKIGGLIGFIDKTGGTFTLNEATVNITQNLNGATQDQSQIGGLVGHNYGGEISNASANATFTYTDKLFNISKVGGLVGEDSSVGSSKISLSTVFAIQDYSSGDQIGCLVGFANGSKIENMGVGSNCQINQSGSAPSDVPYSGGLFGKIENSTLDTINAFVLASNLTSTFGGLAGSIDNSTISNSSISGFFSGASANFGGLAGNSTNSSYTKVSSYSSILLTGGFNSIGGIIGNSQNNTLRRVANYGSISASNSSIVGGLVGYSVGTLTIENSMNIGSVSGDSYVGGLIGQASDTDSKVLSKVYNSGPIVANSLAGGLIGSFDSTGLGISDSFAIGSVQTSSGSAPSLSGGFVGESLSATAGLFSNNFFLSESTLFVAGCGAGASCPDVSLALIDTNTAADSATDQLYYANSANAPLNNWDFTTIWGIFATSPPYLR